MLHCETCKKVFDTRQGLYSHRFRNKDKKCLIKKNKKEASNIVSSLDAEEIVKIANEVDFNQHVIDENSTLKHEKQTLQSQYDKLTRKYNDLIKLIKKEDFKPPRPAMTNPRRLKIASSQGWKCAECYNILGGSFDIDHIVRWADSFDDSDENLRALCIDCHRIKTAQENS